MSRPIAESLSLLSETLGNCKTNLKEKEVADVDNIKISDVDEKIAEIQAGGSSNGFDVDNAKYISVDKDYPLTLYDNFEAQSHEVSITLTVDLTNLENPTNNYFILPLTHHVSFSDTEETFVNSYGDPSYLNPKQSYSSKITLKAESQHVILFIVLLDGPDYAIDIANAKIIDIKRIKVNCS